jgi:hypothetical protein
LRALIIFVIVLVGCSSNKKKENLVQLQAPSDSTTVLVDSLDFRNKLRLFEAYNKNFDKKDVDGYYEECQQSLPTSIIDLIGKRVFDRFKESKSSLSFKIIEADLLCTNNQWKVYTITVGFLNSDSFFNLIGCFNQKENFLLSEMYKDVCSEVSLSSIQVKGQIIEIGLCEYQNCPCDNDGEAFYRQSFELNQTILIKKSRILLDKPCNKMKCDFVKGIVETK